MNAVPAAIDEPVGVKTDIASALQKCSLGPARYKTTLELKSASAKLSTFGSVMWRSKMRTTSKLGLVACLAILFGQFFLQNTAMAAKAHVQKVPTSLAHDICSNGGQSWDGSGCAFCDGQHCHIVNCDKNNKCTNTVSISTKNPGGKTGIPVTQVNGGSNGAAGTSVKHPIQTGSGLKPIAGTNGTNSGSNGGYKGGGMNQGGGYRR